MSINDTEHAINLAKKVLETNKEEDYKNLYNYLYSNSVATEEIYKILSKSSFFQRFNNARFYVRSDINNEFNEANSCINVINHLINYNCNDNLFSFFNRNLACLKATNLDSIQFDKINFANKEEVQKVINFISKIDPNYNIISYLKKAITSFDFDQEIDKVINSLSSDNCVKNIEDFVLKKDLFEINFKFAKKLFDQNNEYFTYFLKTYNISNGGSEECDFLKYMVSNNYELFVKNCKYVNYGISIKKAYYIEQIFSSKENFDKFIENNSNLFDSQFATDYLSNKLKDFNKYKSDCIEFDKFYKAAFEFLNNESINMKKSDNFEKIIETLKNTKDFEKFCETLNKLEKKFSKNQQKQLLKNICELGFIDKFINESYSNDLIIDLSAQEIFEVLYNTLSKEKILNILNDFNMVYDLCFDDDFLLKLDIDVFEKIINNTSDAINMDDIKKISNFTKTIDLNIGDKNALFLIKGFISEILLDGYDSFEFDKFDLVAKKYLQEVKKNNSLKDSNKKEVNDKMSKFDKIKTAVGAIRRLDSLSEEDYEDFFNHIDSEVSFDEKTELQLIEKAIQKGKDCFDVLWNKYSITEIEDSKFVKTIAHNFDMSDFIEFIQDRDNIFDIKEILNAIDHYDLCDIVETINQINNKFDYDFDNSKDLSLADVEIILYQQPNATKETCAFLVNSVFEDISNSDDGSEVVNFLTDKIFKEYQKNQNVSAAKKLAEKPKKTVSSQQTQSESKFSEALSWAKERAQEGAYQGAAKTASNAFADALIVGVSKANPVYGEMLKEVLKTEIGSACVSALMGAGIHFVPIDSIKDNERIQKIADKCAENAVAQTTEHLADLAINFVLPALKSGEESLKARVAILPDVQNNVKEEIEEEQAAQLERKAK